MPASSASGGQELEAAYTLARELAAWAGDTIREGMTRTLKSHTKRHAADWVTEVDQQIERVVRERILHAFPHHRVVGEEEGASGAEDAPTWYVDPVDGTANFVHRLPWSSFSLGLVVAGEPTIGVIADPSRNEIVHARRGHGIFIDDQPVSAEPAADLSGHLLMTELAGHGAWEGFERLLPWLGAQHCVMRVMGSSALSLATAATGRAAATVLHSFGKWDVAAGVALCREAGLTVRDGNGAEHGMPQRGLVAGHPTAVTNIWDVLQRR